MAVVGQNVGLLSDLLGTVEPAQRVQDSDLIPDIARTCRAMQERILMLCEQVTNEDVISELLVLNDRLNEGLHKYDSRVAQDPPPLATTAPAPTPSVTDFSAYAGTRTPPSAYAAVGAAYPTLPAEDPAPPADPLMADFSLNPMFDPTGGAGAAPSPPPPAAAASKPAPSPAPSSAPAPAPAAAAAVLLSGNGSAAGMPATYGGFDADGMPWLPPTEDATEAGDEDRRELATDDDLEAELSPPPRAPPAQQPLLQFDSPARPAAAATDAAAGGGSGGGGGGVGSDLLDLSFAPIGFPSGSAPPSSALLLPTSAAAAGSPAKGAPTAVRALSDDRVRKMEALENDLFGL